MIIDKETNFVYFSSLIKSVEKYTPFWVRLKRILVEKGIHYGFIEHTRDIWCRDYMPIQTGIRQFVQFDYFPDYYLSPKYISQLTIPSEVSLDYTFELSKTDLIIDGGNIVKSDNSAILTDKIWKDNARLKKTTVLSLLKKALGIERIYVIPQLPYDMTGHADGMVRFIDDKNLIVADYSKESKTWRTKMDRALEKTGLNIHLFPSETINWKNEHGDYTAEGVYINFLRIGNIILLPQFHLEKDAEACKRTQELFLDCEIIPILSNEIAIDGGVLNCVTWNIRMETTSKFHCFPLKRPDRVEQEAYVYGILDFYLSTFDYRLIAKCFETVWNFSTGDIIGDGELKERTYRLLEKSQERNFIPQHYVDKTIDLILEYLESIGQYGFQISEN